MCGAEIQARHLGSVKVGETDVAIDYCERCNTITVPIGDGEKPYRVLGSVCGLFGGAYIIKDFRQILSYAHNFRL